MAPMSTSLIAPTFLIQPVASLLINAITENDKKEDFFW